MSIELSAAEQALLLDLLQTELGNLKVEIHRTETRDFKEQLKAREAVLIAIIERLDLGAAPG